MKDEIFSQPAAKQFEFDEAVASVFDDMVSRSVPQYEAAAELVVGFLSRILPQGARVMDLGCSTATTLCALGQLRPDLALFGMDNSAAMLDVARSKLAAAGLSAQLENAELAGFCEQVHGEFDAIICAYTMHFLRPLERIEFCANIARATRAGGVFVLSEKLLYEDARLQKHAIDEYEDYKASRGYSRYEIAQKRAALENVLVPFSARENMQLLERAGFKQIDTLCRWLNFATFLAVK